MPQWKPEDEALFAELCRRAEQRNVFVRFEKPGGGNHTPHGDLYCRHIYIKNADVYGKAVKHQIFAERKRYKRIDKPG